MSELIIGSYAARVSYPDFPRQPKDLDVWTDYSLPKVNRGQDLKDVSRYPGLLKFMDQALRLGYRNSAPEDFPKAVVASNYCLYTLKLSHCFWDHNWFKHVEDLAFFQSRMNRSSLLPLHQELFEMLYADWEQIHGKKRVNLNQTKQDFYTDNVSRVYDHDSVHRAIMYGSAPMYTKILADGKEVLTSRKKFEALDYEDKLKCAREEIIVTALERFLIPADFEENALIAYRKAAKQLVTSMSKGHFPKFILENWFELRTPKVDYVRKFRENSDRLIIKA